MIPQTRVDRGFLRQLLGAGREKARDISDDLSWFLQATLPEAMHRGRAGFQDRMQSLGGDINQTAQQHLGMGLGEATNPQKPLEQMRLLPAALGMAATGRKKQQPLWTTKDTMRYAGLGGLLGLLGWGASSCGPSELAKTITNIAEGK